MIEDRNKDESIKREIAISDFYKSLLRGFNKEAYKYSMAYGKETPFDEILFWYDGDISIDFYGITFLKESMKLRFWCHTYSDEEETNFFIKSMKINGKYEIARRHMGTIKDCGEYIDITVCGIENVAYKDISTIDLIIEVHTAGYEPKFTRELQIVCNTCFEIYMVKR